MKKTCKMIMLLLILNFPFAAFGTTDSTANIVYIWNSGVPFANASNPAYGTGTINMKSCGTLVVSGTTITSTNQNVSLGTNQSCATYGSPGSYGGVGGVLPFGGGGTFFPQCPSDHPYMQEFTQNWGWTFGVLGASVPTIICCTAPQPPMSFTTAWYPVNCP